MAGQVDQDSAQSQPGYGECALASAGAEPSAALLPCPFCGGAAEISQIGNGATKSRGFEVKCTTWGCATKKRAMVIRHTLEDARTWAIAAWNRRVSPASPAPGSIQATDEPETCLAKQEA